MIFELAEALEFDVLLPIVDTKKKFITFSSSKNLSDQSEHDFSELKGY